MRVKTRAEDWANKAKQSVHAHSFTPCAGWQRKRGPSAKQDERKEYVVASFAVIISSHCPIFSPTVPDPMSHHRVRVGVHRHRHRHRHGRHGRRSPRGRRPIPIHPMTPPATTVHLLLAPVRGRRGHVPMLLPGREAGLAAGAAVARGGGGFVWWVVDQDPRLGEKLGLCVLFFWYCLLSYMEAFLLCGLIEEAVHHRSPTSRAGCNKSGGTCSGGRTAAAPKTRRRSAGTDCRC